MASFNRLLMPDDDSDLDSDEEEEETPPAAPQRAPRDGEAVKEVATAAAPAAAGKEKKKKKKKKSRGGKNHRKKATTPTDQPGPLLDEEEEAVAEPTRGVHPETQGALELEEYLRNLGLYEDLGDKLIIDQGMELDMMRELTSEEFDELANAVRMKFGHRKKLRKELGIRKPSNEDNSTAGNNEEKDLPPPPPSRPATAAVKDAMCKDMAKKHADKNAMASWYAPGADDTAAPGVWTTRADLGLREAQGFWESYARVKLLEERRDHDAKYGTNSFGASGVLLAEYDTVTPSNETREERLDRQLTLTDWDLVAVRMDDLHGFTATAAECKERFEKTFHRFEDQEKICRENQLRVRYPPVPVSRFVVCEFLCVLVLELKSVLGSVLLFSLVLMARCSLALFHRCTHVAGLPIRGDEVTPFWPCRAWGGAPFRAPRPYSTVARTSTTGASPLLAASPALRLVLSGILPCSFLPRACSAPG